MTFSIITLGCKVNQYESQAMTEIMIRDGYTLSHNNEKTDIFIINTCSVTSVSDSKNRKIIRRVRRNNPDAVIVVTGCMSQAFPKDEIYSICDIVVGNTSRSDISSIITEHLKDKEKYINVSEHIKNEVF